MSVEKLEPIKRTGFPHDVIELLNLVVGRENREIEVKFDTTSLAAVAKVMETEDKITFVFPRGALGSNNVALLLPFTVLLRQSSSGWVRGVVFNSKLVNLFGISPEAPAIAISGLLTSLNPSPTDSGWIATAAGDKIWLEAEIGTWPALSSASIKSTSNGDTYDGGDIQHDGGTPPAQTFARAVISNIGTSTDGNLISIPQFTGDRRLEIIPADGFDASGSNPQPIRAVYPYPF